MTRGHLALRGLVIEPRLRGLDSGCVYAQRLPTVLTRPEVEVLLAALDGVSWIMTVILYGSGLRLMECLRLRVKDIDFTRNEILVHEGKGNKPVLSSSKGIG